MAVQNRDYDVGNGKRVKTNKIETDTTPVTKVDLPKTNSGPMFSTNDLVLKTKKKEEEAPPPPPGPKDVRTTKNTAKTAAAPAQSAAALPASSLQSGVDETRRLYETAARALAEKQGQAPTWEGSAYDAEIDDLYAQISGRGQFSYDLDKDALWQQLKDSYGTAGKAAMRDTMGQAAALTGGYGSSYAQSVGQQAYDREIEKLLDAAPELEERAYQRWQDEGQDLLSRLGTARTLADDEYGRFRDDYARWDAERAFAASERDNAYSRFVTERGYGDSQAEANRARLTNLIAIGYAPSDQELADAGMSRQEYAAIAAQYAPKKKGGSGKAKTQTPSAYQVGVEFAEQALKDGYFPEQIMEEYRKKIEKDKEKEQNEQMTPNEKSSYLLGIQDVLGTNPSRK